MAAVEKFSLETVCWLIHRVMDRSGSRRISWRSRRTRGTKGENSAGKGVNQHRAEREEHLHTSLPSWNSTSFDSPVAKTLHGATCLCHLPCTMAQFGEQSWRHRYVTWRQSAGLSQWRHWPFEWRHIGDAWWHAKDISVRGAGVSSQTRNTRSSRACFWVLTIHWKIQ